MKYFYFQLNIEDIIKSQGKVSLKAVDSYLEKFFKKNLNEEQYKYLKSDVVSKFKEANKERF